MTLTLFAIACALAGQEGDKAPAPVPAVAPGQEVAVLAGGCFWCLEADLDKLPGVVATTSGYAGGGDAPVTYEEVGSGRTGHTEVVRVVYDPRKVSYDALLDYFWRHVDPTDAGGQFCDRGRQYRTAVFYVDDAQRQAAEASKQALDDARALPGPVVTEIAPSGTFHPAEVYHQDFYTKNPGRYGTYRAGCRRDAKIAEIWKAAPAKP